ncbi:MAG TPA: Rad52/Rad22 family DNA repair protein [Pseudonocardiaceae bacterium]|jgi:hypothetical protein|nr:Rad52/Rad22 family DNA repair protein [Pseudonocardiaceae bacterium]
MTDAPPPEPIVGRDKTITYGRWQTPARHPVTLRSAAPDLRRPFTTHAVQFRILEGRDGKRANCAAYITARTAIDRLNHVCPALWSDHFEEVPGGLRCDITIDGITRSDVGWSSGTSSAMPFKALYSDAFKRAAVKFGVGVSLYALPAMVLYVERGHVRVYEKPGPNGQKKQSYYLTDNGQAELRSRYERWLETHGIEHFGEPLDHGHVAGSVDPEEGDIPEETETEAKPMVLPLEVLAVIERAQKLGHAQFSDPETVHMLVAGRPANIVRSWVQVAHADLDGMEKTPDAS